MLKKKVIYTNRKNFCQNEADINHKKLVRILLQDGNEFFTSHNTEDLRNTNVDPTT